MGTGEFLRKSDEMPRGASYPRSSNYTLRRFMLYENRDKLRLGGPIGSSTYLTFIPLLCFLI